MKLLKMLFKLRNMYFCMNALCSWFPIYIFMRFHFECWSIKLHATTITNIIHILPILTRLNTIYVPLDMFKVSLPAYVDVKFNVFTAHTRTHKVPYKRVLSESICIFSCSLSYPSTWSVSDTDSLLQSVEGLSKISVMSPFFASIPSQQRCKSPGWRQ